MLPQPIPKLGHSFGSIACAGDTILCVIAAQVKIANILRNGYFEISDGSHCALIITRKAAIVMLGSLCKK